MPQKPPPAGNKAVKSYTHKSSKRKKIPTEQTEAFMPDEDKESVNYAATARKNTSAPTLNWNRDPRQVQQPIEMEAHPLYIHEKIHPASFVETLRKPNLSSNRMLWKEFNGFPEGSAYEWYKHSGNWQNRIIRGDSSRIMASLLAKEGMGGKVQMVYYDPPYGISFKSNFQPSTCSRSVGAGDKDIPNDLPAVTAFRDTYKNGIHSYLDNIHNNATLARELLADEGSFFLQMGPENAHRGAIVLDEVFGPQNRVATVPFVKSGGTSSKLLPQVADYIFWYARDKDRVKYRQVYELLAREEKLEHMSSYAAVELPGGACRSLSPEERRDLSRLPEGARLYRRLELTSMHESGTDRSDDYVWNGKVYKCPPNRHWSVSKEGMDRLAEKNRLDVALGSALLHWKRYEEEVPGRRVTNLWSRLMSAEDLHYVVETAESVIERCILMSSDPGDLVMDITCGSGTTAYVAEKWGRRWITTDTSAVAVSLARQRIATGCFDYYLLQDSEEGATKEAALSDQQYPANMKKNGHDVAKGFVYHRVPTVSAAILAYDQEAEPTLLYNKPYARAGSTIRVSSPFTVESESPYRYIAPSHENGGGGRLPSLRTA